jgi:hemin uptake protein HemP
MLAVHPQPDVPSDSAHPAPGRHALAADAVEIDSTRLLKGHREVLIRHGNECYRLRHTRNDKLILTK